MYVYQNSGVLATIMDSEGRSHRIPHDAPHEVKPQISMDIDKGGAPAEHIISAEHVARQLCNDGRFYGVVILPEIRDGLNSRLDVVSAAKESTRTRDQAETELIERYVQHAKAQALQAMPIKPPAPALEKILVARGLDLDRHYGIKPIGYRVAEGIKAQDAKIASQEKEIADLRQMLERLVAMQEKAKQPVKV